MTRESARKALSAYLEQPAVNALTRLGLSANAVTLIGLALAGGSAYLIAVGQLLAAGFVLLLAVSMDMIDGGLARATGQAGPAGAMLDSVADRVSEAVVLLGIVIFYLDRSSDLGVILAIVTLIGSVLVSYTRARAEGLGIACNVGFATRAERVLALVAGILIAAWWEPILLIVLGVVATLALVTTVQRTVYSLGALNRRDSDRDETPESS